VRVSSAPLIRGGNYAWNWGLRPDFPCHASAYGLLAGNSIGDTLIEESLIGDTLIEESLIKRSGLWAGSLAGRSN
jgi:hypothetical protein